MPPTARSARRNQATRAKRGDHRCGKLWFAMRILRRFTASELCAVAEHVNKGSAQAYLNKLRHAGFLRAIENPGQETVWVLIRNSGPQVPAIIRNRTAVWDYNTGTEYAIQ